MTRLARVALAAYPPSFRARYGAEMSALLDDLPATQPTTVDLLAGAVRAWLRPRFSGADARRRRLQATLASTWLAWCAGFLAAPAITRALLDAPVPGATAGVRDLLDAAQALFFVGWALALLGAAPILLRSVLPALRARSWRLLRPLAPALVLASVEAMGLLALVLTRGHTSSHPSQPLLIIAGIWLAGFVAFMCSLGLGPVVALERLAPRVSVLRHAALLAIPVALTLTALTGCCLAAVVQSGHAAILSSEVPVAFVLAIACGASLIAVTSATRSLRAIRAA
jgi:hypothetical protein